MSTVSDQINIYLRSWEPMLQEMAKAFQKAAKAFQSMFPYFRDIHREETRRIHKAYDRKRRARRRRNRR